MAMSKRNTSNDAVILNTLEESVPLNHLVRRVNPVNKTCFVNNLKWYFNKYRFFFCWKIKRYYLEKYYNFNPKKHMQNLLVRGVVLWL